MPGVREPGKCLSKDKEFYFYRWAAEGIRAQPRAELHDTLRTILGRLKFSKSELRKVSLLELSRGWVAESGELTSAGRWMTGEAQDLERTLQQMGRQKNADPARSALARVILKSNPDQIHEYMEKNRFKNGPHWASVADALLETGKEDLIDAALELEERVQGRPGQF